MSIDSILNTRILIAILIYCVFAGVLIFIRPYPLYDEEKRQFRRFGVGPDETLFSLSAILSLGAILAFICVTIFWPVEIGKTTEPLTSSAPTQQVGGGGGVSTSPMPMYQGHNPFCFGHGRFDHEHYAYSGNGSGVTFPPSRIWKSY